MAGGTKKSAKAQGTGSQLEYVEFDPNPVSVTPFSPPMNGYMVHIRAEIIPSSGLILRTTPTFKIYNTTTLVQSGALSPNGTNKWKSDPAVSVLPSAVQVSAIIGNPYDPSTDETYTASTTVAQYSRGEIPPPRSVREMQTFPDFKPTARPASNGDIIVRAKILSGRAICAHLQLWQLGGSIGHESDMEPKPDSDHPRKFVFRIPAMEAQTAKYAHVIVHFRGTTATTVLGKEKGVNLHSAEDG